MAKRNNKRLSERLQYVLNCLVAKQLETIDFACFDRDGDVITSQGTREALNRSDTIQSYVKATHWFDVFWYYVNIQIKIDNDGISEIPFISVSFFQENDGKLNQLFRAEWDNYKQKSHPQPHWHITSTIEDGFESLKGESVVDEDSPFAELENEERKVNFPKMHFAMSGNWHSGNKDNMVNDFTDESQIANWLNNLFDHVREELKHAY